MRALRETRGESRLAQLPQATQIVLLNATQQRNGARILDSCFMLSDMDIPAELDS